MFALLIPVLAAGAFWLLRRRGLPGSRFLPATAGLLTLAGLLVSGPGAFGTLLWRPPELYGEGLAFRIDAVVLPYALLAAAVFGGKLRVGPADERGVLQLALVLATIAADNLLTIVISWSLLAVWSIWESRSIWQLAAVAPIIAAAAVAVDPIPSLTTANLLALAALLRGRGSARPYLEALPAFALLSRFVGGGPGVLLLGAGAIVVATLAGGRWMASGLLGFSLLSAGLQPNLGAASQLASAIALVVAGSAGWAAAPIRAWTAGLAVGGLPLLVGIMSDQNQVPPLLVPAAALLAAPILSLRHRTAQPPLLDWPARVVAAWPLVICGGILVSSVRSLEIAALGYAVGAQSLALLMAAGPRWLYRQPVYARLAENLFQLVRTSVERLLEGLTALVRGINGVLEGESSTLWLFLILLIVVQGLAA